VVGRLALPHRGRTAHGLLPPEDLLEPLIERTPNHHYWLGDFHDDGLDRSAKFRWAPPDENMVTFMVPRLLWQRANPDVRGRYLLENTCGLFTCINPAHWRRRQAALQIPARIVVPETVDAVPVAHTQDQLLVHIRRMDAITTVCGRGAGFVALKRDAPITCDECISAWVRTGQPYVEVT
jgi:hypothetical protein